MRIKNKESRHAKISFGVMGVGLLGIAMPFLPGISGEDAGYAAFFIGICLALTAGITGLMFLGRARVFNRMMEERLLAHWTYSTSEWERICREDLEEAGTGKGVGLFLGGIFLLIGVIVFLTDVDENGLFLMFMVGIALFFGVIGYAAAGADRRRIQTAPPEVWISRDGLFYKNMLYTWNKRRFAYLEYVGLNPEEAGYLVFAICQLNGGRGHVTRYHRFLVSIPIPFGEEGTAQNVIDHFKLSKPIPNLFDETFDVQKPD